MHFSTLSAMLFLVLASATHFVDQPTPLMQAIVREDELAIRRHSFANLTAGLPVGVEYMGIRAHDISHGDTALTLAVKHAGESETILQAFLERFGRGDLVQLNPCAQAFGSNTALGIAASRLTSGPGLMLLDWFKNDPYLLLPKTDEGRWEVISPLVIDQLR